MTTTLSAKGQVVIPKRVRETRCLRPGDDLEVLTPDGTDDILLRKVQRRGNVGMMDALRKMRGLKVPERIKHLPRKAPKL
jgi:AbrB family looped-hinge helix DNA binding protein